MVSSRSFTSALRRTFAGLGVGGIFASLAACPLLYDFNRGRDDLLPGDVAGKTVADDVGGEPIPFAHINVAGASRPTRSKADGEFVVRGLQEGGWLLKFADDREAPFGEPERTALRGVLVQNVVHGIFGGEPQLEYILLEEVGLSGPATLQGTVEGPGGGAPAPGTRVFVYRTDPLPTGIDASGQPTSVDVTSALEAQAQVAPDGTFELGGITPGTVHLLASQTDGDVVRRSDTVTRQVNAGINGDFELRLTLLGQAPTEGIFLSFTPSLAVDHIVEVRLLAHGTPPGLVSPAGLSATDLQVDESGQVDVHELIVGSLQGGELRTSPLTSGMVVDIYVETLVDGVLLRGAAFGVVVDAVETAITLQPLELAQNDCVPGVGMVPEGGNDCDRDSYVSFPTFDRLSPGEYSDLLATCLEICLRAMEADPYDAVCATPDGDRDCDDDGDGVVDLEEGFCAALPLADLDGDGACGSGERGDGPPPPTDAGVEDAGPDDAGVDAGLEDAGADDAGQDIDGGVIIDAGGEVDAGMDVDGGANDGGVIIPTLPSPPPGAATGLSAGGDFTCAIAAEGSPWCWGAYGSLGLEEDENLGGRRWARPVEVRDVTAFGGGYGHACAYSGDGSLYCWGDNYAGQLGVAGSEPAFSPVEVATPFRVRAIDGSSAHTCVLEEDDSQNANLLCFGDNGRGQLGDIGPTSALYPDAILVETGEGGDDFDAVAAGEGFTCGITTVGEVYCWGANEVGQCGQAESGTPTDVDGPSLVALPAAEGPWQEVTAGDRHACARNEVGHVYCWGSNATDQLGPASIAPYSTSPLRVTGLSPAASIAAGGDHTCALYDGGSAIACWGDNGLGQLDGNAGTSSAQPLVTPLVGGYALAAGAGHTCALVAPAGSGGAFCFGDGTYEQVGHAQAPEGEYARMPERTLYWVSQGDTSILTPQSFVPDVVPGPLDALVFDERGQSDSFIQTGAVVEVDSVVIRPGGGGFLVIEAGARLAVKHLLDAQSGDLYVPDNEVTPRLTFQPTTPGDGQLLLHPESRLDVIEVFGADQVVLDGQVNEAQLFLDAADPAHEMHLALRGAQVSSLRLIGPDSAVSGTFVADYEDGVTVQELSFEGWSGTLDGSGGFASLTVAGLFDTSTSNAWFVGPGMVINASNGALLYDVTIAGHVVSNTGGAMVLGDSTTVASSGRLEAPLAEVYIEGPVTFEDQSAVDLQGAALWFDDNGTLDTSVSLDVASLIIDTDAPSSIVAYFGAQVEASSVEIYADTTLDGTGFSFGDLGVYEPATVTLTSGSYLGVDTLYVSAAAALVADGTLEAVSAITVEGELTIQELLYATDTLSVLEGGSLVVGSSGDANVSIFEAASGSTLTIDGILDASYVGELSGQVEGGGLVAIADASGPLDLGSFDLSGEVRVMSGADIELVNGIGGGGNPLLVVENGARLFLMDGGVIQVRGLEVLGTLELVDVDVSVSGIPGTALIGPDNTGTPGRLDMTGGTLTVGSGLAVEGELDTRRGASLLVLVVVSGETRVASGGVASLRDSNASFGGDLVIEAGGELGILGRVEDGTGGIFVGLDADVAGTLRFHNITPFAAGSLVVAAGGVAELGSGATLASELQVAGGGSVSSLLGPLQIGQRLTLAPGASVDVGRGEVVLLAPQVSDTVTLDLPGFDGDLASVVMGGSGRVLAVPGSVLPVSRSLTISGHPITRLILDTTTGAGSWSIDATGARRVTGVDARRTVNAQTTPFPVPIYTDAASAWDAASTGWGAVCGNGLLERDEECDDSNTGGGDGCDASCDIERTFGSADSCLWVGTSNDDPFEPDNWSCALMPGGTPLANDTVVFTGSPPFLPSFQFSTLFGSLIIEPSFTGNLLTNSSIDVTRAVIHDCAGCSLDLNGAGARLTVSESLAVHGPLRATSSAVVEVRGALWLGDNADLSGGSLRLRHTGSTSTFDGNVRALASPTASPLSYVSLSSPTSSPVGFRLGGLPPMQEFYVSLTYSNDGIQGDATVASDTGTVIETANLVVGGDYYSGGTVLFDASVRVKVTEQLNLLSYYENTATFLGEVLVAGAGSWIEQAGGDLLGGLAIEGTGTSCGYGCPGGYSADVTGPLVLLPGSELLPDGTEGSPGAIEVSAMTNYGGTLDPDGSFVTVAGTYRQYGGHLEGAGFFETAAFELVGGTMRAPGALRTGSFFIHPGAQGFQHACGSVGRSTPGVLSLNADGQSLWQVDAPPGSSVRFAGGTSLTVFGGMDVDGGGTGSMSSQPAVGFVLDARGDLDVRNMSAHDDVTNVGPGYVAQDGVTSNAVKWVAPVACGNGTVDLGEECDMGGANGSGAGCSAACTVAPHASCVGVSPSSCEFDPGTCGDGIVTTPSEQCDDGSFCEDDQTPCTDDPSVCSTIGGGTCLPRDYDGCSSSCTVEPGDICWGCPSRCFSNPG